LLKNNWLFLFACLFTLNACVSADQVEEAQATLTPGTGFRDTTITTYEELLGAFQAIGLDVEPGETVQQPLIPVDGQTLMANDEQIQIFEFADEASRSEVSDQISVDGYNIGGTMVNWIDSPTIWASGQLIVIYLGTNESNIGTLSTILDNPIASSVNRLVQEQPAAVSTAIGLLGERLNLPHDQIQVVSAELVEWPDTCYGLPMEGEVCAQQMIPGWRVVLEAQGNQYIARSNELGSDVRFE
jgi:hypothetical protein